MADEINISKEQIHATQNGANSVMNNVVGNDTHIVINSRPVRTIYEASQGLRSCNHTVGDGISIERSEVDRLYQWCKATNNVSKPEQRVAILEGVAGTGKTVVMRDLLMKLEKEDCNVLALKSDQLFDDTQSDLDTIVGLGKTVLQVLKEKAAESRTVLLIDQVDALSATLSKNRTPIDEINKLVYGASTCKNIRIVLSCRPYDMRFDSALDRYHTSYTIKLGNLQEHNVDEVLAQKNINLDESQKQLKLFLCNPLNLFLFCRLSNPGIITGHVNINILYNALWDEIIIGKAVGAKTITTESLVRYLDVLTNTMTQKQVLTINKNLYNTQFANEQNYLITNGILTTGANEQQVQFIHQTLYDYVYARLFFEQGRDITKELNGIHQGLFIRSRIKQIINYQRNIDEGGYKALVYKIMTEETADGKPAFRFHIKHLVVSGLGFYDYLIEFEKQIIKSRIMQDSTLSAIFAESVNTISAFIILRECLDSKYGTFNSYPENWKKAIITAVSRISWKEYDYTLQYLYELPFDEMEDGVRAYYHNALNSMSKVTCDERLHAIVERIVFSEPQCYLYRLLTKLITVDDEYVFNLIERIILKAVSTHDFHSFGDIQLQFEYKMVLDTLEQYNDQRYYDLYYTIVNKISHSSILEASKDQDIKCSFAYCSFNRSNSYQDFASEALIKLIDILEKPTEDINTDYRYSRLQSYKQSDLETDILLALVALTSWADKCAEEGYDFLLSVIPKTHASSVLDYYIRKLFQKVFLSLTIEQQDALIDVIAKISPEWEKKIVSKIPDKPISRIGVTRCMYYALIPTDVLKRYPRAFKELESNKRNFSFDDESEPNKVEWNVGWPTMKEVAYQNMNDEDLIKSMLAYTDDNSYDWGKPTLTGHSFRLRDLAKQNPERYLGVYLKATKENVNTTYIINGIEGLLETGINPKEVEPLVNWILTKVNSDISKEAPGFLMQVIRILGYYTKRRCFPPVALMEFVCKVAKEYKDIEEHSKDELFDVVMEGINQVRGSAASNLVEAYYMTQYKESIFDALETLKEASVATRGAALFQLGLMGYADLDRMIKVFNILTSDHNPNFYRLEMHRFNPVLFFYRDHFEELVPYFEGARSYPAVYDNIVRLLWDAWRLTNNTDCRDLLLSFADATEEARASLVKYISFYYNHAHHEKVIEIYTRYLKFDEDKLGKQYDFIFNKMDSWTESEVILYMNRYTNSAVCKYASTFCMEQLHKLASLYPEKTLIWANLIYQAKKHISDEFFNPKDISEVVIIAYNRIREFGYNQKDLEAAMDIFDEMLEEPANRPLVLDCLNAIEES